MSNIITSSFDIWIVNPNQWNKVKQLSQKCLYSSESEEEKFNSLQKKISDFTTQEIKLRRLVTLVRGQMQEDTSSNFSVEGQKKFAKKNIEKINGFINDYNKRYKDTPYKLTKLKLTDNKLELVRTQFDSTFKRVTHLLRFVEVGKRYESFFLLTSFKEQKELKKFLRKNFMSNEEVTDVLSGAYGFFLESEDPVMGVNNGFQETLFNQNPEVIDNILQIEHEGVKSFFLSKNLSKLPTKDLERALSIIQDQMRVDHKIAAFKSIEDELIKNRLKDIKTDLVEEVLLNIFNDISKDKRDFDWKLPHLCDLKVLCRKFELSKLGSLLWDQVVTNIQEISMANLALFAKNFPHSLAEGQGFLKDIMTSKDSEIALRIWLELVEKMSLNPDLTRQEVKKLRESVLEYINQLDLDKLKMDSEQAFFISEWSIPALECVLKEPKHTSRGEKLIKIASSCIKKTEDVNQREKILLSLLHYLESFKPNDKNLDKALKIASDYDQKNAFSLVFKKRLAEIFVQRGQLEKAMSLWLEMETAILAKDCKKEEVVKEKVKPLLSLLELIHTAKEESF